MTDSQGTPTVAEIAVSPAAETQRIIRTGTIWLAAVVIAPALILGPMLASGWRPADLVAVAALPFWIGAVASAIGVCLLVWAGCPVLGFGLDDAHRQKVFSIRVGIVLALSGQALAMLAILLSPAG
ncbi:hypothetical protein QT381_11175 [Galbitalea sp. SE-J8]|uniref:hypothetical protein n=1 Tax=Galbitalea sp. SE-J8 TaxID=3054952 RepID=UPI00259C9981|nr:hypothetical protein [Galbitalea sp. SE-J8]MDM4763570.1 hypothetical protein [Galbitalea sp. SE-J8]